MPTLTRKAKLGTVSCVGCHQIFALLAAGRDVRQAATALVEHHGPGAPAGVGRSAGGGLAEVGAGVGGAGERGVAREAVLAHPLARAVDLAALGDVDEELRAGVLDVGRPGEGLALGGAAGEREKEHCQGWAGAHLVCRLLLEKKKKPQEAMIFSKDPRLALARRRPPPLPLAARRLDR